MQLEELLVKINENMDKKFNQFEQKMDKKLDKKFEQFEQKIYKKLDKRFEQFEQKMDKKLDKRFEQFEQKMDKKFDVLTKDLNSFKIETNQNFDMLSKDINAKLDIITKVNLPQILTEQTKNREEQKRELKKLNDKLDFYIAQNEVEHKKFEYKIANIEMKQKIG